MAKPTVIIVGSGFGGLAAAKALRRAPVQVTLIDRTNHHLFQPLLYQVATAALTPSQIAAPIRGILRDQGNARVILGEVTGVDKERKCVFATNADHSNVPLAYDYLILATGATHSYFGHNEFEQFAPGMKSLADAVSTRNKVLQAFELAEAEEDPSRHRDLLTFVLVGAGPTGVELAGALGVLVRTTLKRDFRRIDPASARIVLVDMAPRVLGAFSEPLSQAAKRRLDNLGVEVRLGHSVDQIDDDGVVVAGERITSKTVIWTAGVAPSPAGKWLQVDTDRAGRVRIQSDLTVPGYPEIFVIGDTASFEEKGKPLPGVAQVAMQQGRHAAKVIHRRLTGGSPPGPFSLLRQRKHGRGGQRLCCAAKRQGTGKRVRSMDDVGVRTPPVSSDLEPPFDCFPAVLWSYVTGQRGSRLIVNHHASEPERFCLSVCLSV